MNGSNTSVQVGGTEVITCISVKYFWQGRDQILHKVPNARGPGPAFLTGFG